MKQISAVEVKNSREHNKHSINVKYQLQSQQAAYLHPLSAFNWIFLICVNTTKTAESDFVSAEIHRQKKKEKDKEDNSNDFGYEKVNAGVTNEPPGS